MAWALLFLLLFELLVARSDWFWTYPERSRTGVFHVVERRVMARRPEPLLAVVGSSRARDAVVPSVLEQELGLSRGAVANVALTAGSSIDARELLRRDREWFARADVLAVCIEDWWVVGRRALEERERRFATLEEHREAWGRRHPRALAERYAHTLLASRRIGSVLEAGPRMFRAMRLDDEDRIVWRAWDVERGPETVRVDADVRRVWRGEARPAHRIGALRDVVREARALGLRVVLVQIPWRDEYVDAVADRHPDAWADYRRLVRDLAAELGVPLIAADRGTDIGLDRTVFRDYGHITDGGARAYSAWLAGELRAADRVPSPR